MRSFSMLTFAGDRDPRVLALGSMEPFKICLFYSNSTNIFYATVTKLFFCPITYCNLHVIFNKIPVFRKTRFPSMSAPAPVLWDLLPRGHRLLKSYPYVPADTVRSRSRSEFLK